MKNLKTVNYEKFKKKVEGGGLIEEKDTHEFINNDLTYRCIKCGWMFDVPPNQYQQIVVLKKRRRYECPLTEEMKQKYGFITT